MEPADVSPDALAFQDELDALVGEPTPLMLRLWPALGGAMIIGLIGAAALTRVDVVVTATGRLVSEAPPVVLQPMGSAVLRELRVQPGESVKAGQVLAMLDSTFTSADRETLESQRRSLAARKDRLEAELAGGASHAPAAEGAEALLQSDLRASRRSVLEARLAAISAELDALDAAWRAERTAGAGLDEQLAVAREVEGMRARLAEDQVGSRLNLLTAQSTRLQIEQERRRHEARLEDLAHRKAARAADLDAYLKDWERQILEELAQVRTELARIEEQLAKAARLDALTHMRAPRDAVVLEVARRSPGSLMREGEPVVTLVPTGVPLIAEIGLASADIGRLKPGDEAALKIDSFPWRRHGTLPGTLGSVSRESYAPQGQDPTSGQALHRGRIMLTSETLRDLPSGAALLPGMTLSADIKVGARSVLDFFLEPLVRGLHESLREP